MLRVPFRSNDCHTPNNVVVEKIIVPGQSHLAIIYRGACSDGKDPAMIAANRISSLLKRSI